MHFGLGTPNVHYILFLTIFLLYVIFAVTISFENYKMTHPLYEEEEEEADDEDDFEPQKTKWGQ